MSLLGCCEGPWGRDSHGAAPNTCLPTTRPASRRCACPWRTGAQQPPCSTLTSLSSTAPFRGSFSPPEKSIPHASKRDMDKSSSLRRDFSPQNHIHIPGQVSDWPAWQGSHVHPGANPCGQGWTSVIGSPSMARGGGEGAQVTRAERGQRTGKIRGLLSSYQVQPLPSFLKITKKQGPVASFPTTRLQGEGALPSEEGVCGTQTGF